MSFKIKKITEKNLHILKNLFQLYIHDISKDLTWNVNSDGLFESYSLDDFFKNKDNFGYYIYQNEFIVGFVMIDKEFMVLKKENALNFSEIFILNGYKRKGIASAVAKYIIKNNKVNWEIRPVPKSETALFFWENVLKSLGYTYTKTEIAPKRYALTFSNI